MTERQALQEARKRWGKAAKVKLSNGAGLVERVRGRDGKVRLVGRVELGLFFSVRGMGPTWADALGRAR